MMVPVGRILLCSWNQGRLHNKCVLPTQSGGTFLLDHSRTTNPEADFIIYELTVASCGLVLLTVLHFVVFTRNGGHQVSAKVVRPRPKVERAQAKNSVRPRIVIKDY